MLVPWLKGRSVLMVNSSANGGGVAEMLPTLVLLLRELGVETNWAVISSEKPQFFKLTKRIHNLIHDHGDPNLGAEDKSLYDEVSRANAEQLRAQTRGRGPDAVLEVFRRFGAVQFDPIAVTGRMRTDLITPAEAASQGPCGATSLSG